MSDTNNKVYSTGGPVFNIGKEKKNSFYEKSGNFNIVLLKTFLNEDLRVSQIEEF